MMLFGMGSWQKFKPSTRIPVYLPLSILTSNMNVSAYLEAWVIAASLSVSPILSPVLFPFPPHIIILFDCHPLRLSLLGI
jgi:hypothetical protein